MCIKLIAYITLKYLLIQLSSDNCIHDLPSPTRFLGTLFLVLVSLFSVIGVALLALFFGCISLCIVK